MWLQRVTSSWNKEEQGFQNIKLKSWYLLRLCKVPPDGICRSEKKERQEKLKLLKLSFLIFFFFLLLCFSTTYWMIHHHYLFNTQQIGVAPNTMDVCEFYINSIGFTKKTLQTWHRVILVGLKVISSIHTNH